MQLAGLLDGEYSGVPNGSAPLRSAVNSPTPTSQSIFEPNWNGSVYGGNYLEAQIETASSNWSGAFSGNDLRAIDSKLDDGQAANGIVRGASGDGTTCIGSGPGSYIVTDSIVCRGIFLFSSY